MRTIPFTITTSVHGMPCVEADDLSLEQCQAVRRVVTNNWSESEDYRLSQPTGRFLQGYAEPRTPLGHDGWVLVEFWNGRDRAILQAFVDHLSRRLGLVCDACKGAGRLPCTLDDGTEEVQRCDACMRFETDDEARAAGAA